MNADQILVLEEGKLVGKGTHRELLKNCSAYQEIARSQLSESELKGGHECGPDTCSGGRKACREGDAQGAFEKLQRISGNSPFPAV